MKMFDESYISELISLANSLLREVDDDLVSGYERRNRVSIRRAIYKIEKIRTSKIAQMSDLLWGWAVVAVLATLTAVLVLSISRRYDATFVALLVVSTISWVLCVYFARIPDRRTMLQNQIRDFVYTYGENPRYGTPQWSNVEVIKHSVGKLVGHAAGSDKGYSKQTAERLLKDVVEKARTATGLDPDKLLS